MTHVFTLIFKAPQTGALAFLETSELFKRLLSGELAGTSVHPQPRGRFAIEFVRSDESLKLAAKAALAQVLRAVPGCVLVQLKSDADPQTHGTLSLSKQPNTP